MQAPKIQAPKKPDPEYIQSALNHINWWRMNFGLESPLQKLYGGSSYEEFATNYKNFIRNPNEEITTEKSTEKSATEQLTKTLTTNLTTNNILKTYTEDAKFIESLSGLAKHNIYAYCLELGYAENPNNYSYSYAGFLIPKSFVKKAKEIADADESVLIYLTDATWELEQRNRENYAEPNPTTRELRVVTNDIGAKYYNFIWKRFPCEIFDVKSALFEHFSQEYVSMQIRHGKIGNHIHWIMNTVMNIVGEI